MGCCMSKPDRSSEGDVVGTSLIRMSPPTRRPGFRPEGPAPHARIVSLPVVNYFQYPTLCELGNSGLSTLARPSTSSGITDLRPIPRIDITRDVIVEQDESVPGTPPGTADKAGDDTAVNATTTTTIEGGGKVASGTVAPKDKDDN
ncbi:hypothetical protein CDV31_000127 [Fusarium ambrosium]|uniref:Uncharacterized protein n=1 Tax=Fusarium ambrosium TaxID=131363 RepID=A0A428V3H8_9HYPO|nr:hypothetical protein CDV31_000127 [Fusarium ambrosium]